LNGEL